MIVNKKENEEGVIIGEEVYVKDITKMIDLHEHYEKSGDRIDLFYGQVRVYMVFRKSKEARKKFAEFLIKTKEWIVIEKVLELPIYTGKRIR